MSEAIQGVGPSLGPVSRAAADAGPIPWYRQRLWRTLRRGSGLFNVGFLLLLVILAALTAPWITLQDPTYGEPVKRLRPPAWQAAGAPANFLGTDQLGRDVYTRSRSWRRSAPGCST